MKQQPALLARSIDLLSEWRSGRVFSGVVAGAVNAVLTVNMAVAFTMMIWGGSLAPFAAAIALSTVLIGVFFYVLGA